MNNECGAKYFDANAFMYTCQLVRHREGAHYDYRYRRTWPQNHPYRGYFKGYEPKVVTFDETTKQTSVLLTLEDLKAIAFFLSDSGVDAVPETVAKIDAALKGAL